MSLTSLILKLLSYGTKNINNVQLRDVIKGAASNMHLKIGYSVGRFIILLWSIWICSVETNYVKFKVKYDQISYIKVY